MSIIEAVILGIIQGLTEFLPVSSSGHLALSQKIIKIEEPSLFFDTMLHAGTLTAVFAVLWKDIWEILKRPFQKLTLYLIIATIPAVITALVFKDSIENIFISARFLGWCFLITTVLLITAEVISRRASPGKSPTVKKPEDLKTAQSMNWLDALIIGVFQALAIPPGVSRSGATISGALLRGLDRDFAARFSFLMSIPAILGALVLQVKELADTSKLAEIPQSAVSAPAVIAGTLTAAAVGFFAVRFMLKIIREKSLYGFAVYTGVLGALVLFDQFVTRMFF